MKILHKRYLEKVESTNTYVKTRTSIDQTDGLLIYTFNQTKGRGRRANSWNSKKNEDIALSIIHHDVNNPFKELMQAALSVVRTLETLNISANIKLPNDIYVDGQKIAGILIEKTYKESISSSIIGIGININSARIDNHNEISIKDVLNRPIDKNDFISQFIDVYNNIEEAVLYSRFKTYIDFDNHLCEYEGEDYNLLDINEMFMCKIEKKDRHVNVPCQHLTFNLKNE